MLFKHELKQKTAFDISMSFSFIVGFVEEAHISDFQFDNQRKTFQSYGNSKFFVLYTLND